MEASMIRILPVALMALLVFAGVSFADDVTDQIELAKKAYRQNDFNKSMEALDTASILIRQKRSDSIEELLPSALPGWKAGRKKSKSFMGMLIVSRTYTKGVDEVEITVDTGSPLMDLVGALYTSRVVAGDERKLRMIDGRRVNYDTISNHYLAILNKKTLVKVEGTDNVAEEILRAFYKKIDIEKLIKLVE